MTIQTKHFIGLSDLISLRFECKDCGTTLTISVKDKLIGRLYACPSCRVPWALINGVSYEVIIEKFREAVTGLAQTLEGPSAIPIGLNLSIEIKADAIPEKD